jgi:hypothetical protein
MRYFFLFFILFFSADAFSQNHIRYSVQFPKNMYYASIYLDTFNHYYYIDTYGGSFGTYEIINDSTWKLKAIIEDKINLTVHSNTYFCKKNKIQFNIKQHFIDKNIFFNFDDTYPINTDNYYSAVIFESHDGRIKSSLLKYISYIIEKDHITTKGYLKKIPKDTKSIRLIPLTFYKTAFNKGKNIKDKKIENISNIYLTNPIGFIPQKGSCTNIETLYMNNIVWTTLGLQFHDKGDTIIFSKDKNSAKLLSYRWKLLKNEKDDFDGKIINIMSSIKDILNFYSKLENSPH